MDEKQMAILQASAILHSNRTSALVTVSDSVDIATKLYDEVVKRHKTTTPEKDFGDIVEKSFSR